MEKVTLLWKVLQSHNLNNSVYLNNVDILNKLKKFQKML